MKLHQNTVQGVIDSLDVIFHQNGYADKVIERTLKSHPKWGARDRGFVAETVYEMVRWWRLIQALSPSQDLYKMLGTYLLWKGQNLPDWKEFKTLDAKLVKRRLEKIEKRAILESIPDWMDELGESALGSKWDAEIAALNEPAAVVLRANSLKTSVRELAEKLQADGIQSQVPNGYPDALVLAQRQNIFRSAHFKEGLFEVQDASSQLVARALDVAPGMRIVDACAGAGGKSLHLAALMENKGRILSMDVLDYKLKNTKLRARRAGVSIIETRVIESNKTIKRLRNSADRLLLDAPCSGMGVLKRNPDTKWKLSMDEIERVKIIQQEILQGYTTMLKPGGRAVYATCSILPDENEKQVERFLSSEVGRSFRLIEDQKILAHECGFDGFYIAQLEKTS
ncbi:TRNA and rRNA cytosine-C5-methylase [Lunatimonas lonarensis]|uniref:tRNA and rRNA cytosine-C5-methylase n=1 Tax=Lunatimonas lonarensis TaxID=1232681 RepID=R7ZNN7_9BACT|nr:RsmB/NOP family class I SAM-dependent RNA methyltransferase [Lunatimonas lonarensis]EON75692.1 TRNA and rRNA cytosine-C5-methylase [Lunatimonas lonarensis]